MTRRERQILNLVRGFNLRHRKATYAELARYTGLSLSSVRKYVRSLALQGYLKRDSDGSQCVLYELA